MGNMNTHGEYETQRFFARYLKNIVAAILVFLLLVIGGIVTVNNQVAIERKTSSYKLTAFDYILQSPTKKQLEEYAKNDDVLSIFSGYNYNVTARNGSISEKIYVLTSEDMTNSNITFFSQATLLEGKYDPKGLMLDRTAADNLGVSVGSSVRLSILGTTYNLTVCGIYMPCSYTGFGSDVLSQGIGLTTFTAAMAESAGDAALDFAFVDATDEYACDRLFQNYVPYGQLMSYEKWLNNKGYDVNNMTEAESKQMQSEYAEYKTKFESANYPAAVQRKADYTDVMADRTLSAQQRVNLVMKIVAVAVAVVYSVLGVVFILIDRGDDERRRNDGVSGGALLGGYVFSNALSAIAVCILTAGVTALYAMTTGFFEACLPVIALFSLPVLLSIPVVAVFAILTVNRGSHATTSGRRM